MDTITLSNALKAVFGTSQTTATNIPVCAADGTPGGNISVANLASVLGGLYGGNIGATTDINDVKTTGFYLCNGDAPHLPSLATYLLEVIVHGSVLVQKAYKPEGGDVYIREYRNSWNDWVKVALNYPAFWVYQMRNHWTV